MVKRTLALALALLLAACTAAGTPTPPASPSPDAGVVFERIAVTSAAPVDGALRWSAYAGAVGYVVVYSDVAAEAPGTWSGPETMVRVGPGEPPDADTIALVTGTSYRWFVYAIDEGGATLASSEPQEFTCDTGCP